MKRFFFDEQGWLTGRGALVIFGAIVLVAAFILPADCVGSTCP